MTAFLPALTLRNYRGIGADAQVMAPFKRFNFFIGPNNAGKSIVLNFISKHLPMRLGGHPSGASSVDPLEVNQSSAGAPIEMAIGLPKHDAITKALAGVHESNIPQAKIILTNFVESVSRHGFLWLGGKLPYEDRPDFWPALDAAKWEWMLQAREWNLLWMILTEQNEGGLHQHWIPETLQRIRQKLAIAIPNTRIIPAIRQIGPKGSDFGDYSGSGLIDRLAQVQSPDHDRREDRLIFDKINGFLRQVTGNSDAQIEVPHNREHILVHMDGKVLPLSSLGTGIQEVVMIASFCTISENEIVCIEEPELHLHPLLQRKLVEYLTEHTSNQYFIATHSAAFIDTPGSAIFHVKIETGQTRISEAILRKERHAICSDLGYRASDLVQSNCVVWVEGPSDRTYIKHWIRHIDSSLVEGTHYSLMFYGGRLLNHLSADDHEVSEFIELRSLNRNLALVMDSDKAAPRERVNATKKRLLKEISGHGGVVWITKGREIENYIDHGTLQEAVASVYGSTYARPLGGSSYDHALHFTRTRPKRGKPATAKNLVETNVDKVKVAKLVCQKEADLKVLDLAARVQEIVELIRRANA